MNTVEINIQDRSKTISPMGYLVLERYRFAVEELTLSVLRIALDKFLESHPEQKENKYIVARIDRYGMEMSIGEYKQREA
jgi:hypothetical protein